MADSRSAPQTDANKKPLAQVPVQLPILEKALPYDAMPLLSAYILEYLDSYKKNAPPTDPRVIDCNDILARINAIQEPTATPDIIANELIEIILQSAATARKCQRQQAYKKALIGTASYVTSFTPGFISKAIDSITPDTDSKCAKMLYAVSSLALYYAKVCIPHALANKIEELRAEKPNRYASLCADLAKNRDINAKPDLYRLSLKEKYNEFCYQLLDLRDIAALYESSIYDLFPPELIPDLKGYKPPKNIHFNVNFHPIFSNYFHYWFYQNEYQGTARGKLFLHYANEKIKLNKQRPLKDNEILEMMKAGLQQNAGSTHPGGEDQMPDAPSEGTHNTDADAANKNKELAAQIKELLKAQVEMQAQLQTLAAKTAEGAVAKIAEENTNHAQALAEAEQARGNADVAKNPAPIQCAAVQPSGNLGDNNPDSSAAKQPPESTISTSLHSLLPGGSAKNRQQRKADARAQSSQPTRVV